MGKEELVEDNLDLVISESKCTVHNKHGKRQLLDDSESLPHQDSRKNFKCMCQHFYSSHSNVVDPVIFPILSTDAPTSLILDQDSEPRSANGHFSLPINDSLPLEDVLNKLPCPCDIRPAIWSVLATAISSRFTSSQISCTPEHHTRHQ